MKLIIFCDGGARGNPGPASIGIVIRIDNRENQDDQENREERETERQREKKISKFIGIATNNQAEYRAVIEALDWLIANRKSLSADNTSEVILEVEFFLDSKLVVEQLNGRYKLKNEGLKPLFWQARDLILKLGGKVSFQYIPREKNTEADRLVNEALDKVK